MILSSPFSNDVWDPHFGIFNLWSPNDSRLLAEGRAMGPAASLPVAVRPRHGAGSVPPRAGPLGRQRLSGGRGMEPTAGHLQPRFERRRATLLAADASRAWVASTTPASGASHAWAASTARRPWLQLGRISPLASCSPPPFIKPQAQVCLLAVVRRCGLPAPSHASSRWPTWRSAEQEPGVDVGGDRR
jgi:hypothetical protein